MTLIEDTRRAANPVESGDLDAFIEQYGWPLIPELKYDGERAWIQKEGNNIIAFNKHQTTYFPDTHEELFKPLRKIKDSFLIEGEMCSSNGNLYSYLSDRQNGQNLMLYAFDILELNGNNLRDKPLIERRHILDELIKNVSTIKIVESFNLASKQDAFDKINEIIKAGHEGVVIKSPSQKYNEGAWLKFKRQYTIDAVITGITKSDHYLLDNLARSYRLGLNDRLDGTNPPQNGQFIPNYSNYKWIGDCGSGLAIYEKEVLTQLLESSAVYEDKEYISNFIIFLIIEISNKS